MELFVIHPGWIISKNDGDMHYLDGSNLMKLYRVHPSECIIATNIIGFDPQKLKLMHHLYSLSGVDYRPVTNDERALIRHNIIQFEIFKTKNAYKAQNTL